MLRAELQATTATTQAKAPEQLQQEAEQRSSSPSYTRLGQLLLNLNHFSIITNPTRKLITSETALQHSRSCYSKPFTVNNNFTTATPHTLSPTTEEIVQHSSTRTTTTKQTAANTLISDDRTIAQSTLTRTHSTALVEEGVNLSSFLLLSHSPSHKGSRQHTLNVTHANIKLHA